MTEASVVLKIGLHSVVVENEDQVLPTLLRVSSTQTRNVSRLQIRDENFDDGWFVQGGRRGEKVN